MQEPSYLGKIARISSMVQDDIDPNNTMGMQRFSNLDAPTMYEYFTGMNILILVGTFLNNNFDVDYGYHTFTYIPDQHCLNRACELTLFELDIDELELLRYYTANVSMLT